MEIEKLKKPPTVYKVALHEAEVVVECDGRSVVAGHVVETDEAWVGHSVVGKPLHRPFIKHGRTLPEVARQRAVAWCLGNWLANASRTHVNFLFTGVALL